MLRDGTILVLSPGGAIRPQRTVCALMFHKKNITLTGRHHQVLSICGLSPTLTIMRNAYRVDVYLCFF